MKSKAYYSQRNTKQIASLIIMAFVAVITVFCSVLVKNAVEQADNKIENVDFIISKTVPDAVHKNKFGVTEVEKALDSQGNVVAYIIKNTTIGYNTQVPIEMAATITADGKAVCEIDILKQSETEYLGVRIVTDDFKNQFKNRKLPLSASNSLEKGSKVDVIAKSTISSQAVIKGVNNAAEYVNTFLVTQ